MVLNPMFSFGFYRGCVREASVDRGAASASRKVRAPQGRVPGNARASRGDGKCNRKYTADGRGSGRSASPGTGKGEKVR
jgi:hypothetical protein